MDRDTEKLPRANLLRHKRALLQANTRPNSAKETTKVLDTRGRRDNPRPGGRGQIMERDDRVPTRPERTRDKVAPRPTDGPRAKHAINGAEELHRRRGRYDREAGRGA